MQVERTKLSQKVLYYFTIFAIVNELLIIKHCCINPSYRLMQARDKMRPPSDRSC